MRTHAVLIPGLVVLEWLFAGSAGGQPAAGKDAAVAAARARQKAVKTADIEFRQTEVLSSEEAAARLSGKKAIPFIAEKDRSIKSVNRLVIDGIRIRYEDNHPAWGPALKAMSKRVITVFNGASQKRILPEGFGMNGKPLGTIKQDARHWDGGPLILSPITVAFRGLDRKVTSPSIADLEHSGATLRIRGSVCQKFVLRPSPDRTETYWLDPDKDYVPSRIRNLRKGHLVDHLDIDYRRDEVCGWVPASWVHNHYYSGALSSTTKVDVLRMRLNEGQAAGQFDIRFPAGTQVTDDRTGKNYRVKPDGTMLELPPTGKKSAAPTNQPWNSWYQDHRWLLLGLGLVLAAVVGVSLSWRKRVKQGSSG
jgi:hypothetical protein